MNSLNENAALDRDSDEDVLGDPMCQPIGIAFSPVSDKVEAATSQLSNQSLVGLISIASPATKPCTFNTTSTVAAVVMVQPQVTIPANFTTAPVYGIFQSNTGVKTPSVYITAVGATLNTPLKIASVTSTPAYARILIPPTANCPALTSEELVVLSAAVKVKSISFTPATVKGGDTSTGTITLDSIPTEDTTVFLGVNANYEPYFHLPPSVVVKAHSNPPKTTVQATVSSPPSSFTMTVTGQSGDNLPVESNDITVKP